MNNDKPAYIIESEARMPRFYVDWDKDDAVEVYNNLRSRWLVVFMAKAWEIAAPMQPNGKRPRKHKVLNDADWALVAERAESVMRQEIASKNA